jgi:hypothetical protein
MAQHDFVPKLEEFKQLYKTIHLVGLQFLGNLTPEVKQWLEEHDASCESGGTLEAGFCR